MSRDAAFWNGIAERYAARPVDDEAAYAATLERVRHWLPPDASVLELGCGTGSTALRLADAAGSILGTDIAPGMIDVARRKAEAAGTQGVSFEVVGAAEAGQGQRFDAVMAFNLLHLVEDRPALLRIIRSRLAPGGLFLSKTPCLGGKPWLRPVIFAMRCFGKAPPSLAYLRPDALEREIAAAGFEIVETGDYPRSLPNHFVVARAV